MKLLYNGVIYGEDFDKKYSAVLINKDKIQRLFKDNPYIDDADIKKIDLKGKTVLPGFHDCHIHLELFTRTFSEIRFESSDNIECFRKKLIDFKKDKYKEEWINGGGFGRPVLDNNPDKSILDKIYPNNPVFLYSYDIHTYFVNSKALEFLSEEDLINYSKYMEKDYKGEYTGIIFEKGYEMFEKHNRFTLSQFEKCWPKALKALYSKGITSVHNMDSDVIFDFFENNKTDLKTLTYIRKNIKKKDFEGYKLFLDGSLGSLTAWMKDLYDNKENSGIPVISESEIKEILKEKNLKDSNVAIHAIGDKANNVLLNEFDKYKKKRWRIEHAQILDDSSLDLVKDKILSMQPVHIKDDIPLSKKYLKDRQHFLYRFKSILEKKGTLFFGSDAPVASFDVLEGIYYAVERYDAEIDSLWTQEERIDVREALKAYTQEPGKFEKNNTGIIKEGYIADLVVLDKDIFSVNTKDILNLKVKSTWANGTKVY